MTGAGWLDVRHVVDRGRSSDSGSLLVLAAPAVHTSSAEGKGLRMVREIWPQQTTARKAVREAGDDGMSHSRRSSEDATEHVLDLAWTLSFSEAAGALHELRPLAGEEVLVMLTVVSENAGCVGRVVASVFPDDAGEERWYALRHEDGKAVKGRDGHNMAILLRLTYSNAAAARRVRQASLAGRESQTLRDVDVQVQGMFEQHTRELQAVAHMASQAAREDAEQELQLKLSGAAQLQAAHESKLTLLQTQVEALKAELVFARREASRSRDEERKVLENMRLLVERTQAEQSERARLRATELAEELGQQQLVVRALKREMRQRLEDLSCREASLQAKVVSFDKQMSSARDAWREELTLHELALERERELRALATFNKNLSLDIQELNSTYKATLKHQQLIEEDLAVAKRQLIAAQGQVHRRAREVKIRGGRGGREGDERERS